MECFNKRGDGICQSCGKTSPGHEVRARAIEVLRARGWVYGSGVTIGGQPYEALLCPSCTRDEKRPVRVKRILDQDALPFDWEQGGAAVRGAGIESR